MYHLSRLWYWPSILNRYLAYRVWPLGFSFQRIHVVPCLEHRKQLIHVRFHRRRQPYHFHPRFRSYQRCSRLKIFCNSDHFNLYRHSIQSTLIRKLTEKGKKWEEFHFEKFWSSASGLIEFIVSKMMRWVFLKIISQTIRLFLISLGINPKLFSQALFRKWRILYGKRLKFFVYRLFKPVEIWSWFCLWFKPKPN